MLAHLLGAAAPFVDLKSGAAASMATASLGAARKYFVVAIMIGYLLEAFGKAPTDARDYAACTWRWVVLLFLLTFYTTIFGSVVNLTSDLAAQVTPPSVIEKLVTDQRARLKGLYVRKEAEEPAAPAVAPGQERVQTSTDLTWKLTGGLLFDSLVTLIAALGLVINWVVTVFAALLVTLFYILGPLALVCAVPRNSDTGTRWFAEFVTFCSWPIISGLLLQITVSFGSHLVFGTGAGPLATVASALLMTVSAIATPVLASRLVGGSVKSAAAHGAQTAAAIAQKGTALSRRALAAVRAASGDPTAAAGVARAVAPSASPSNSPGVH